MTGIPTGGLISRKPEEIARVLGSLLQHEQQVQTILDNSGLTFSSQLVFVDPEQRYICLALSDNRHANDALLSRPRASFVSTSPRWHFEFAAAEPRLSVLGGSSVIRMDFPEVMVSQEKRRVEPRLTYEGQGTVKCLADDRGVASFEGDIVDISQRGIGFLMYQADITLEPGTVLHGCRIQRPGETPIAVDLEVRYSTSVPLPNGGYAHRSGCLFLNPTRRVTELIESFNG